ncbi:MAG: hypothetical protein ISS92_02905 [Candidatus Omnitrophica bacterium]|nr:hypothetical protein [Candidatus Omnitrophota bacterium]
MKILFLIILFMLVARPAYAFISPNTLNMLSAAMGSAIWAFAAIFFANIFLFFKKPKFKVLIRVASLITIAALVYFVASRFIELKKLNMEDLSDVKVKVPEAMTPDESLLYDEIPLDEYEVDLNEMTLEELTQYRFFQIASTADPYIDITGAETIEEPEIEFVKDLPNVFENIEAFAREREIAKDDNLLFICRGGASSSRLAILFNKAGYKASFAMFINLKKDNGIFTTIYDQEKPHSSNIILEPYSWRNETIPDAYIAFKFIDPLKLLPWESRRKFIIIYPDRFDPRMVKRYNIVCFTNAHSLVTKYFLDYHGIDNATIYKFPIDAQKYRDWDLGEIKRLKEWKR